MASSPSNPLVYPSRLHSHLASHQNADIRLKIEVFAKRLLMEIRVNIYTELLEIAVFLILIKTLMDVVSFIMNRIWGSLKGKMEGKPLETKT